MTPDLSVRIGSLRLKNPVLAASGTFGFGEEYAQLYDSSILGGLCTKAITLAPRPGNPPPRLWETPCGLLNSIGLENPGIGVFLDEILPRIVGFHVPIIANIWGESPTEYAALAGRLAEAPVAAIEVNVSCPNVPGKPPVTSAADTRAIVRAVRRVCPKPLWVKLSPEGDGIGAARAAAEEGAEAISAVNTFRGMAIDIDTGRPVFARGSGGLSGPAIRPLAVRVVYELAAAVSIPVVGIGGIVTPRDAVEFIMAGAHAVQVGTANFVDPLAIPNLIAGLGEFMGRRTIRSWEEVRGCAHRN